MKLLCILVTFMFCAISLSQEIGQIKVHKTEKAQTVFPDSLKEMFKITLPIYRIYEYFDNYGKHFIVLTEDGDSLKKNIIRKIEGLVVKLEGGEYSIEHRFKDQLNLEKEEESIWFWSKYLSIKDADKDGWNENLFVYGSKGLNGTEDGRLVWILYRKEAVYRIVHQSSVIDDLRRTTIDAAIYELPPSIQEWLQKELDLVIKNQEITINQSFESAFKEKKTSF